MTAAPTTQQDIVGNLYVALRHNLNRLIKKFETSSQPDNILYATAALDIEKMLNLYNNSGVEFVEHIIKNPSSVLTACIQIDTCMLKIKENLALRYSQSYERTDILKDLKNIVIILSKYYAELPKMHPTIYVTEPSWAKTLCDSREFYSSLIALVYKTVENHQLRVTGNDALVYFQKQGDSYDYIHQCSALSHGFIMEKLFYKQTETLKRNIKNDPIFGIAFEETRKLYIRARAVCFSTGLKLDLI